MSIFLYLYLYKYKEIKILSHPKFSSVKSQRRVLKQLLFLTLKSIKKRRVVNSLDFLKEVKWQKTLTNHSSSNTTTDYYSIQFCSKLHLVQIIELGFFIQFI